VLDKENNEVGRVHISHWNPGKRWKDLTPIPKGFVKEAKRMRSKHLTYARAKPLGAEKESVLIECAGLAWCKKGDSPSKKLGRDIALERLQDQVELVNPDCKVVYDRLYCDHSLLCGNAWCTHYKHWDSYLGVAEQFCMPWGVKVRAVYPQDRLAKDTPWYNREITGYLKRIYFWLKKGYTLDDEQRGILRELAGYAEHGEQRVSGSISEPPDDVGRDAGESD